MRVVGKHLQQGDTVVMPSQPRQIIGETDAESPGLGRALEGREIGIVHHRSFAPFSCVAAGEAIKRFGIGRIGAVRDLEMSPRLCPGFAVGVAVLVQPMAQNAALDDIGAQVARIQRQRPVGCGLGGNEIGAAHFLVLDRVVILVLFLVFFALPFLEPHLGHGHFGIGICAERPRLGEGGEIVARVFKLVSPHAPQVEFEHPTLGDGKRAQRDILRPRERLR